LKKLACRMLLALLAPAENHAQPARQSSPNTAQMNATHTAERPRLIVAIIVDQFRYDYTTRFATRSEILSTQLRSCTLA
jgi:hypothetical protein